MGITGAEIVYPSKQEGRQGTRAQCSLLIVSTFSVKHKAPSLAESEVGEELERSYQRFEDRGEGRRFEMVL